MRNDDDMQRDRLQTIEVWEMQMTTVIFIIHIHINNVFEDRAGLLSL